MKKTCIHCGIPKDEAEFRIYFHPNRRGKQIRPECKACATDLHRVWSRTHIRTVMIYSAKHRAKRDGVPFRITRGDIEVPECCPVLGHKLEIGTRQSHEWAPTLDRIIPGLGYVLGNIRVISHRANRLKADATQEELHLLYLDSAKITDTQVRRIEGSTSGESPSEISSDQDGSKYLVS